MEQRRLLFCLVASLALLVTGKIGTVSATTRTVNENEGTSIGETEKRSPHQQKGVTQEVVDQLMAWIMANGGTMHPAVEIRTVHDTESGTSFRGLYVGEDVLKDSVLMTVPSKCLVTQGIPKPGDLVVLTAEKETDYRGARVTRVLSTGQDKDSLPTFELTLFRNQKKVSNIQATQLAQMVDGALVCGTVDNLVKEMNKGADSFYAPYTEYLQAHPSGQIPTTWSVGGQDLLRSLLDEDDNGIVALPPSKPFRWKSNWRKKCHGKAEDIDAAVHQLARSFDDVLIPGTDLLNHRNGKYWENIRISPVHWARNVTVTAARDLQAGEQLYLSYNLCEECDGRLDDYGTPQILRDYGFVESYPQRWHFPAGNGKYVAFELGDEMENNETSLKFKWLTSSRPDTEKIGFFERQLKRVTKLGSDPVFLSPPSVPTKERQVVHQYHAALVVALQHVLAASAKEPRPTSAFCRILLLTSFALVFYVCRQVHMRHKEKCV